MSKETTAKKTVKSAEKTETKTAAPKLNKRQLLKKELEEKLEQQFSVTGKDATDANLYNALVLVLRDRMRRDRVNYIHKAHKQAPAARQDLCGGVLAKGSQGSSVGAEASGLQEVGRGAPVCEPQSPDQGS